MSQFEELTFDAHPPAHEEDNAHLHSSDAVEVQLPASSAVQSSGWRKTAGRVVSRLRAATQRPPGNPSVTGGSDPQDGADLFNSDGENVSEGLADGVYGRARRRSWAQKCCSRLIRCAAGRGAQRSDRIDAVARPVEVAVQTLCLAAKWVVARPRACAYIAAAAFKEFVSAVRRRKRACFALLLLCTLAFGVLRPRTRQTRDYKSYLPGDDGLFQAHSKLVQAHADKTGEDCVCGFEAGLVHRHLAWKVNASAMEHVANPRLVTDLEQELSRSSAADLLLSMEPKLGCDGDRGLMEVRRLRSVQVEAARLPLRLQSRVVRGLHEEFAVCAQMCTGVWEGRAKHMQDCNVHDAEL